MDAATALTAEVQSASSFLTPLAIAAARDLGVEGDPRTDARALTAWVRAEMSVAVAAQLPTSGLGALRLVSALGGPPSMADIARASRRPLTDLVRAETERVDGSWRSYDLLSGLGGRIAVYAAVHGDLTDEERSVLDHATLALARRATDPALTSFRPSSDDAVCKHWAPWNIGAVNSGMGHGIAGVLAVLSNALSEGLVPASERDARVVRSAVANLASRLIASVRYDDDGVPDVPLTIGGGASGSRRGRGARQAWCYGVPGAAVALGRAATALRDCELGGQTIAMWNAFVRAGPLADHVDGPGLCHGAAGWWMLLASLPSAGDAQRPLTPTDEHFVAHGGTGLWEAALPAHLVGTSRRATSLFATLMGMGPEIVHADG